MDKYVIIPMGDNCVPAISLKEIRVRKAAYPFDWVSKRDEIYDSNIIYNIEISLI